MTTLRLYTRKKVGAPPSRRTPAASTCLLSSLGSSSLQPNYEQLEKEVERRKVFLAEAKLKAKGFNPDGTPALAVGGFSPASKPCSPNVVKVEEKSPNPPTTKAVKKEPDNRTQISKSPHNG